MSTKQIDNKRIAKNTLMLYIRMLLTMAVTLYSSRVVLNALGVVDYGIYNVVQSSTESSEAQRMNLQPSSSDQGSQT